MSPPNLPCTGPHTTPITKYQAQHLVIPYTLIRRMYDSLLILNRPTMCDHYVGCHGTTRLPGAGEVKLKEGAIYGPPRGELALSSTKMASYKRMQEDRTKSVSPNWRDSYKHVKPALPDKTDRPVIGITTNKNFVTANAVEAILMGSHTVIIFCLFFHSIIFSPTFSCPRTTIAQTW